MITVDLRTFYDIIYRKAFSGGDNLEKVDGRKNNGGHRKGSGRPKLMPGESKQRGIHMIRAFDDEYKIKTMNVFAAYDRLEKCCDNLVGLEEWIDFRTVKKKCEKVGSV